MSKEQWETFRVRALSTGFTVLALAVFKPFGLDAWHWEAYIHLLTIMLLGLAVCMTTEIVLKYVVGMPRSLERGVGYIIRRNLWFQIINTPLITFMICLYRHFVLSARVSDNLLSWGNFLETFVIIAFCSFAIGLYWRFKFRNRFLAMELEETRLLNEQILKAHQTPPGTTESHTEKLTDETITLTGTTSEKVTLRVENLLYLETVGNYVKVCHLHDGKVLTDMLRTTSKQIESDLSHYPMIIRCHRAFLVNLRQIEKIVSKAGNMQLLIGHDSIPVSRSNAAQVKDAIKKSLAQCE